MKLKNLKKSATATVKSTVKSSAKSIIAKTKAAIAGAKEKAGLSPKEQKAATKAHVEKKVAGWSRKEIMSLIALTGRNPFAWHNGVEIKDDLCRAVRDDKGQWELGSATDGYIAVKGDKHVRIFRAKIGKKFLKVVETVHLGNGAIEHTNGLVSRDLTIKAYGAKNVCIGDLKTVTSFVKSTNMNVDSKHGKDIVTV